MNSADLASGPCPLGRAAGIFGDRWTLLIMRNATLGATRFEQFRTGLGIADNILSNRLGKLVDAGVLTKEPYEDGNRIRSHYRITQAGVALRPVLEALAAWGHTYANPAEPTIAVRIVHLPCGLPTADGSHCDVCDTGITNEDAAWVMPWVSEEPIPLATAAATAAPDGN
ncbi:helix-turn-helix transcriptional regulator [Streptomyces sp. SID13666]|uniref:winged helix-turn-helix transcriptional regulator n=1 Tax=unclassified Streptomyces TaxID=2593676 RepID=UPI0013C10E81|nr:MULTISPECIES: helix-turn-helix domain-containing protein [unclassified Streptomyces]NEA52734.1 helix-turn-helix transcriptional regulator [Streptomyces sp. SID13666]NEA69939.1 helix-turn-helix transcriptional regulator [Streptomyces sp. SID13588]